MAHLSGADHLNIDNEDGGGKDPRGSNVVDLMAALKNSLGKSDTGGKKVAGKAAAKASAKKETAKTPAKPAARKRA